MAVDEPDITLRLRVARYANRAGFSVLLATEFLLLGWAVLFLTTHGRLLTTPTAYLLALVGQQTAAVVLLAAAVCGFIGIRKPGIRSGVWWMVPQIFLVFMAASSAFVASLTGRYPDGVLRPGTFIATDHLLTILFAFLHAWSVSIYHGRWWTISSR